MSTYDDYFTNDDKPFAENLNDALLLSNVFDLTVPIELPRMFTNSAWVNSVSPRKAGVSIVTLDEQLSGISIGTDSDDNSILTATEDTAFGFYFYPNFNSFGQIHSISWEGTDDITVDLYTDNNVLITENINNGSLQESSVHLRQLKPLLVVVNMPDESVLNSFTIVMQNKQQDRYGAEVGISDVNGLNDRFANLETTMTENYNALDTAKVDKVAGKQLSTNDFTNTHKNGLEFLMNVIVSEEVYFTTEQFPQPQFMVGSYSNQRVGSAILESKLLFQRFGIAAGSSILLYVWDTDREEADLPASLKNIVRNKQSKISYSNSNLILELINNNTNLQIRNTGTTSIANGSISYNEE